MQTSQLGECGFVKLYIQRLTLVYLHPTMRSHFHNPFLLHFIHCFVVLLQDVRDAINLLDGSIVVHYLLSKTLIPDILSNQIFN